MVETEDDGTINLAQQPERSRTANEPGFYRTARRTHQQQAKPVQRIQRCHDVPQTEGGCSSRIHRCRQTTAEDPITTMQAIIDLQRPFFHDGDSVIASSDDTERRCRAYRTRHLNHLPRQQQQICTDQLRHLPAEVLL